jgi:hypothetical protein
MARRAEQMLSVADIDEACVMDGWMKALGSRLSRGGSGC